MKKLTLFVCLFVRLRVCSRLITCEADKSIKIWKENSSASEESHPIDMASWSKQHLALKRF